MLKFFIILLLLTCNLTLRNSVFPGIPDNIDKEFCTNRDSIGNVVQYIKYEVDSNSWEDVQGKLVISDNPKSIEKSLNLQKARNLIANCIVILFEAIPTGSARNLKEINTSNALKDIDMSVSYDKLENANNYLKSLIPKPEKTLLFSILMNPIDILPCKRFKGLELKECVFHTSLETTQVILLREFEGIGKVDDENVIPENEWKKLCSGNIVLPDKNSKQYKINLIESKESLKDFIELMPSLMSSSNNYSSALRYNFFYIALNNPAYYLQAGSIRKWVIDREEIFSKELKQKYPDYNKIFFENENESAVIEQWIHAQKNNKNIYYKYKYLFRALDHIGYDYKIKLQDFNNIIKVLKKNRPENIYLAFDSYNKQGLEDDSKEFKKFTFNEFNEIFSKAESIINEEINFYFEKRKKEGNSIYDKVCKR